MVMHAMQKWMVNININKAQQFAIVCVCVDQYCFVMILIILKHGWMKYF